MKKNIINEGVTDELFHQTSLFNLYNILKTNKFKLSTRIGSDNESFSDEIYYFSTARSLTNAFFNSVPERAIIKLSGRRLSQRYKGMPIDYWHKTRFHNLKDTEAEDRIVTDKPYIENAKKYIEEIHVLIPSKSKEKDLNSFIDFFQSDYKRIPERDKGISPSELSKSTSSVLRKIIILCKKNNINIYIYADPGSYRLLNKRDALDLKNVDIRKQTSELSSQYKESPRNTSKELMHLLRLYYAPNSANLPKETIDFKKKLLTLWRKEEYKYEIVDEIYVKIRHRKKSEDNYIDNISRLIKKHKGIRPFINLIYKKWDNMNENKTFRVSLNHLRKFILKEMMDAQTEAEMEDNLLLDDYTSGLSDVDASNDGFIHDDTIMANYYDDGYGHDRDHPIHDYFDKDFESMDDDDWERQRDEREAFDTEIDPLGYGESFEELDYMIDYDDDYYDASGLYESDDKDDEELYGEADSLEDLLKTLSLSPSEIRGTLDGSTL